VWAELWGNQGRNTGGPWRTGGPGLRTGATARGPLRGGPQAGRPSTGPARGHPGGWYGKNGDLAHSNLELRETAPHT